MKKRRKTVTLITGIALSLLLLTGCSSSEQKQEAQELVEKYSDEFEAQARLQYGMRAKVRKIQVETGQSGSFGRRLTGNLLGVVSADGQEFEAIFLSEENIIHSKKNYESICASMLNYFSDRLDAEIFAGECGFMQGRRPFLPDNIKNYEQLIMQFSTNATICTTEDISAFDEARFSAILNDLGGNVLSVHLLQVEKKVANFDRSKAIHVMKIQYTTDGTITVSLLK